MVRVTLHRTGVWELGEIIGSGGAGQVYLATSETHAGEYVIKLVRKTGPAAFRELLVANDLQGRPNIVPVLDIGETETGWALLMPRADSSLRQHIEARGPSPEGQALPILIDIARALDSLTGVHVPGQRMKGIVHRDLKPENVLYLDGSWCISDFGISRYHDKNTERDTTRYFMSQDYAAPEQWSGETAIAETDVYALGIIAFELLMGSRPFVGSDLRQQHRYSDPPPMPGVSSRLATIITQCLYKQAGTRPSPSRLVKQLESLTNPVGLATSSSMGALQAANLAETARRGQEARRTQQALEQMKQRESFLHIADLEWLELSYALKAMIIQHAPTCRATKVGDKGWQLQLADIAIAFSGIHRVRHNRYPENLASDGTRTLPADFPFEVIAHCYIAIGNPLVGFSNYCGRAHSLWFCDAQTEGRYLWYETAFTSAGHMDVFSGVTGSYLWDPQGQLVTGWYDPLAPHPAHEAVVSALGVNPARDRSYKLAWPFTPLPVSELDEFIDRWATWFAEASQGKFPYLSVTPTPEPKRSWRLPTSQAARQSVSDVAPLPVLPPNRRPEAVPGSIYMGGRPRRSSPRRVFRRVRRKPMARIIFWCITGLVASGYALKFVNETEHWAQYWNDNDPSAPWKVLAAYGLWVLVGVSALRIWLIFSGWGKR